MTKPAANRNSRSKRAKSDSSLTGSNGAGSKVGAQLGAKAGAGLRVVQNASSQSAEVIENTVSLSVPEPHAPVGTVIANPSLQEAEEISLTPAASNTPRLSNGFKIVQNRAYQRPQKIKRSALTVPVDDEIGYKKLFTKFEEAFLAQDIAAIGECLSPAFQWHQPNGNGVYGKKEALEEMERRFATPNGPKFSGTVWRFKGTTVIQTYDVEYLGPDGRWRQSRGMDLYEIGDGLITLKDAYWKMIP